MVLALRREVEMRDGETDPLAEACLVSRRAFRAAFVELMRWMASEMDATPGSTATPGSRR